MGEVCRQRGEWQDAIKYYQQAMKIDEEQGNKVGISIYLGNLGFVYLRQGDFQKAKESLERALILHHETNRLIESAEPRLNLIQVLLEEGELEEVINQIEVLFHLTQESGLTGGAGSSYAPNRLSWRRRS